LRACGAMARLLPEVDRLWGVPQRADYHPEIDTGVHLMMVLDMSARLNGSLAVRFACLGHDLGKGTTPADVLPRHLGHEQRSVDLVRRLCKRLRVPVACRELAEVVAREHGNVHRSGEFGATAVLRLIERCDAIRRPERFAEILLACECDARGRLGLSETPYLQRERLGRALELALAVDTAAVAAQAVARGHSGPELGEAIHAARAQALASGWDAPAA
jgi:tRNA nucleotidyltransferase (CCA-adding enzyme)